MKCEPDQSVHISKLQEVPNMKYSQNEKILQITEETLIVGIDIASKTHFTRAIDFRGFELDKVTKFSNDAEGFTQFVSWAGELKTRFNKLNVIVEWSLPDITGSTLPSI